jgi:fatty-acyl-CoA synthase
MPREGGNMITNFSRVMATMAMRYRHNIAVVNMERNRRYTYPEYHRLTNRIANMSRDALHGGAAISQCCCSTTTA